MKKLLLLLCVLGISSSLMAADPQKRVSVKGAVTDLNNVPLAGVSVIVVGTTKGTITDANGNYTLKDLSPKAVLTASFLGYTSAMQSIDSRTVVDFILQESSEFIEEVVAIGYGVMKKSDLTGAMQSVDATKFANQTMQTPEQALKGRVSGVRVLTNNAPGGGVSIQIRGANSMLGGTEPLYVVDGFPMEPNGFEDGAGNTSKSESSLNFINPDDVESIEVLKDASATAIYGARGANGVVLITTKSGKSGKTEVSYSGKFAITQLQKKMELLDEVEFGNYMNQREINRYYIEQQAVELGLINSQNLQPIELPFSGNAKPRPQELAGVGTDWQDAIYRNAFSTDHTLSISGGSEKTKFMVSGGYSDQNGIITKTDFKRYSINSSLEHKISRRLKFNNKISASHTMAHGGMVSTGDVWANRGVVTNALWYSPLYAKYSDPTVEDLWDVNNGEAINNPYLLATLPVDEKKGYVINDVFTATLQVAKDLDIIGRLAASRNTNKRSQYFPMSSQRGKATNGYASIANNALTKYMTEIQVNYNRKFKSGHNLSLTGVVSYENIMSDLTRSQYEGFPSDDLTFHNPGSASNIYAPITDEWQSEMNSYVFRGNYKYKERYFLTATFRADGTSRGAKNLKFGYFPSVAVAWRLNNESFLKDVEWLSNLKLRASFGVTGQAPNVPYQSLSALSIIKTPFDGKLYPGVFESSVGNKDLSWETTRQYNLGLDASLFNGTLNFSVDYYAKRTYDLLQFAKMPPSSGYPSRLMNLGDVENKGVEFEIRSSIYNRKNVFWEVFATGSVNKNKLVALGDRDYISGDPICGVIYNRFAIGQPLGVFYGLTQTGIFRDWDHILNSEESVAQRDALPGDYIFKNTYVDYKMNADGTFLRDDNGNKIPAEKQVIDEKDFGIIGDPNPDFEFGFGTTLRYKNFDFSALFTGQIGGDVIWIDYGVLSGMWQPRNMLKEVVENSWMAPYTYTVTDKNNIEHTYGSATGNLDGTALRAMNWDKDGSTVYTTGKRTRYRNENSNSSMVHDGSYLKLQNLVIGYTFKNLSSIKSLRVSFSATNLFCLSSYPGYDPELISSQSPMMRGIDLGSYPSQRTYSCNIQIKF